MVGRYLTEFPAEYNRYAKAAGLPRCVMVNDVVGGKIIEGDAPNRRARSTGGYPANGPWCVMDHHTVGTSMPFIVQYQLTKDAAPGCNIALAPDGTAYVIALGATNTNGTGRAVQTSKGLIPQDAMNRYAFAIEIINNGQGGAYPKAQIDALFVIHSLIAKLYGGQPDDVCTHQSYRPSGKFDPATAAAVQGGWKPRSINSSGSWSLDDDKAESRRRHPLILASVNPAPAPTPTPTPDEEDDDMLLVQHAGRHEVYLSNRVIKTWVPDGETFAALKFSAGANFKIEIVPANAIAMYGPIVGPRPPGIDEYGRVIPKG